MAWHTFLSSISQPRRQASLQEAKETPLQLEQLESRQLLAAEPISFDLNPTGDSDPRKATDVGAITFFVANDGSSGAELWKTDGTSAGTVLVKDINPGSDGSAPYGLTNVNGTLFFQAFEPSTGTELWISDGTSAGTVLVKDTNPGTQGTSFLYMTNVGGQLFFRSSGGSSYGSELWKSDGTSGGTVMIKDINPGPSSSGIDQELAASGATLYFQANDGSTGPELWRSDGTSVGTVRISDLISGSNGSYPHEITNVNGTIYFSANSDSFGTELWRVDFSVGAVLVKDINPGTDASRPDDLTNVNGTLYFSANDGTYKGLWKTDGTSEGTELLKVPYLTKSYTPFRYMTNINGTLFFSANDGTSGMELWKSDGTSSGTVMVKDINPGTYGSYPYPQLLFDGEIYFSAYTNANGTEIWKTDGTSEGTMLVADVHPGVKSSNPYMFNVNGNLIFIGTDATYGDELWRLAPDETAPTLEITPDGTTTNNSPITFTFQFSEEIVNFTVDDINVTGGTKGTLMMVDEDTYTLEVTPSADGSVTVSVADDTAEDTAGNLLESDSATVTYDSTAPSLEITPDGTTTPTSPITFTFQFSEVVTGFIEGDISITNGSGSNFMAVDGDTYTLDVTPTAAGTVTVMVASEVAQDAAMNDNTGDSASVTYSPFEEKPLIVTGSDTGGGVVRVFNSSGVEQFNFFPFTAAFTGGVRVATGDINNDGVLDIVTAAGPGGGPRVSVYDSETGQLITGGLSDFFAYASNITVGIFVAVGDVNNDGYDDIITGVDAGAAPHVKVFNGQTGAVITEFYAYNPSITVGVRVAAGDVNGDGTAEVITATGPGGGPHIRVFNGSSSTGVPISGAATDFYAYAPDVTTGVYIASGDVDNDGKDDIITAPGAGGGPHVKVFSSDTGGVLKEFYAYNPSITVGVRVGAADLNDDGFADILTTPGPGGGPHTRAFSGTDLADLSNFFSGSPTNTDGLFVAGGVSVVPLGPASAPLSSSFVSTEESDPPEDITLETLTKKKSWYDEVDEFYSKSEEVDDLFSGLVFDSNPKSDF
ncbi:Hypothetical protein PBC10988_19380 [Planctomycetales bacterium 10988]|nr:Hypothetical protein PBC10988_19380 [Planctomycetales bacterium 10988]